MAAELTSNAVQSGTLKANVTMETPSASCLPSCARSVPSSMTAMPPRIGSQTTTLRIGQFIRSTRLRPEHDPTDERRETHDHRERVVIEIPRLQAARDGGQHADGFCAAVDGGAVDQR